MSSPPPARFCIYCGAPRSPEALFCSQCGSDLRRQDAAAFAPAAEAEASPIPVPWVRTGSVHPVRVVVRRSPRHGRLGGLFRLPLALAAGIMVLGWWVAAVLAAIAAWPFLLARRPYPGTLLRVTAGWVEFSTRASCYAFMLTPAFPRLSADGPVDVALPEPSRRPWLRLPAVVSAWPVLVLEGVVSLLCSVVAWFAVVILGRLPDGMAEVMEQPQRYRTRFWAYALLLCDTYPWFQPEQPVPDPGVVIGGE